MAHTQTPQRKFYSEMRSHCLFWKLLGFKLPLLPKNWSYSYFDESKLFCHRLHAEILWIERLRSSLCKPWGWFKFSEISFRYRNMLDHWWIVHLPRIHEYVRMSQNLSNAYWSGLQMRCIFSIDWRKLPTVRWKWIWSYFSASNGKWCYLSLQSVWKEIKYNFNDNWLISNATQCFH